MYKRQVYRNKPQKPLTVSELFGLGKKEEKKEEPPKKEEIKKEVKVEEKTTDVKKEIVKEESKTNVATNVAVSYTHLDVYKRQCQDRRQHMHVELLLQKTRL